MRWTIRACVVLLAAVPLLGLEECQNENRFGVDGDLIITSSAPELAARGLDRFSLPENRAWVPARCQGISRIVPSGRLHISWTCILDPDEPDDIDVWEGALEPDGLGGWSGSLVVDIEDSLVSFDNLTAHPFTVERVQAL